MHEQMDTFPALLPPETPEQRMTLTMAAPLDPNRAQQSRNNFYHPVCVAERLRAKAERERAALVEVVGIELVELAEQLGMVAA